VSASDSNQERCNCGEFLLDQLDQYVQLTGIDGEVMELKYTTKDMGKIGSGSYSDASFS